jgi:hypothetical protein
MYYDETGTLVGFCVREIDPNGKVVIEERYPLYPRGMEKPPYGASIDLLFRPRLRGERKNSADWSRYQAEGRAARSLLPTVYIHPPGNDMRVELSLFTLDGTRSEWMTLLPRKQ